MSSAGSGSSSHARPSGAYACARRRASATVNAWFASTITSNASPTAARTAPSRATSSAIVGLPTLSFAPRNPASFAATVSSTSCCDGMVQPPAFGRVDGDFRLRAARGLPQRQSGAPALEVPQRGVDRREREARDRADRRRVRVKEQVLPDRLDAIGVAADESRREVVAQQRDDRRAARADRVRVARALGAVVAADAHDRRFLADERLDRVGALHLRHEVDLQDFDALDAGAHG